MKIIPKNWRDFQHYKDRNPPWIRLHKKLLDDFDFHRLPVASRALSPMLWLLASESIDGIIDMTVEKIAFRMRMSELDLIDAIKPLIKEGFFILEEDASNQLADCLQVAVPMHCITSHSIPLQRQRAASPLFDPLGLQLPPNLSAEDWSLWCQHRKEIGKPLKPASAKQQLSALGLLLDAGAAIRHSVASGYQGIFEPKKNSSNGFSTKEDSRAAAARTITKFGEQNVSNIIDITPASTKALGI